MTNEEKRIGVALLHRHHGVYTPIRETSVPASVVSGEAVDEEKLLNTLPNGFVGRNPEKVLLILNNEGVLSPTKFRDWGKYFDTYALDVSINVPCSIKSHDMDYVRHKNGMDEFYCEVCETTESIPRDDPDFIRE